MSPMARFWAKVAKSDGCWEWTACRSTTGYGRFRFEGRTWFAHRWLMESLRGEIADGLDVDHLCRNRLCVRPDHLEIVTHAENMARSPYAIRRRTADVCQRGHADWAPLNRVNRLGEPYRYCRTCSSRQFKAVA